LIGKDSRIGSADDVTRDFRRLEMKPQGDHRTELASGVHAGDRLEKAALQRPASREIIDQTFLQLDPRIARYVGANAGRLSRIASSIENAEEISRLPKRKRNEDDRFLTPRTNFLRFEMRQTTFRLGHGAKRVVLPDQKGKRSRDTLFHAAGLAWQALANPHSSG
jgi:hypothetical protein